MSWDFSTDPDFQAQLDWMNELVRHEIWPLETIWRELGQDGLQEAIAPLQREVKAHRLWGLALRVQDLDRTLASLAPHASPARPAVQPGRRIATVRRSAGIGIPLALMSAPGE